MGGASYLYGYIVARVGGSAARQQAVTIAGALLIMFGYPIAMETLTRGRTVGALALGLRVVRDDGGAIRFRQALLRGLAFWAVDFAIWTGFCGGLVCAAVNPMSKRFGDLMAGTIVIRTRSPRPPAAAARRCRPAWPPGPASWSSAGCPTSWSPPPGTSCSAPTGLSAYPRDQLATTSPVRLRRGPRPRRRRPLPPWSSWPPWSPSAGSGSEPDVQQQWVPTAAELPAGWR